MAASADPAAWRRAFVAAGLLFLIALVAIGLYGWFAFGDMGMSASGYLALALGIIGTLALAIGLMTLVYFSNRYGYDDEAGGGEADRRD